MIDLDRIEQVAKAAQEQNPGPWRKFTYGNSITSFEHIVDSSPRPDHMDDPDEEWIGECVITTDSNYYGPGAATADYIVGCSPDVVLALVAIVKLSVEYERADAGETSDVCDAAYLKWRAAVRALQGKKP